MRQIKGWKSLIAVAALLLVAGACGDDDSGTTTAAPGTTAAPTTTAPDTTDTTTAPTTAAPTTAAAEPDEVSVILDWLMEGSYAPLLWGVDQGIFADHGIELDIIPGQGSDLAMGQINQGEVDFAFTDLETYLVQRARGETDTTATYAWLNQATIGVASMVPLEGPEDMAGLTWGTVGFSSGPLILPFVLEENGVDPDSVTIELLDFSVLYSSFFQGELDSVEAHLPGSTEGLLAAGAEQGIDVQFTLLADWGLQSYSKMLIIDNATIAENPDLVSRFMAALHESMLDALENMTPEDVARLLPSFDPQIDGELQAEVFANFQAIIENPGPLDPDVIQATIDRLVATQGLEGADTLVLDDLYDNSYIE